MRVARAVPVPPPGTLHTVEVGQEWAAFHGGVYDLFVIVEVLDGTYYRPPDVALIPTEFCKVRYLTGRLKDRVFDQRAPDHQLGHSGHALYKHADGHFTRWGKAESERIEARKRQLGTCPHCGRTGP